jgi:hypothetical protein
MTNLNRYDKDGLELVINTETGEVFASISAVARMCDKTNSTINRYVNGELQTSAQISLLNAKILTATGLKTSALLNESQILEVINKYKPSLLIKFAQVGLRMFLHQLAGYEVKPVVKTPSNFIEALELALVQAKEVEKLKLINESLEDDNLRQSEIIDELFDYSSIVRIAKYNAVGETSFNWRLLKSASGKLGIEIKKAPCPRFGEKNLYSHDAWRLAYPEYKLPETTTLRIG